MTNRKPLIGRSGGSSRLSARDRRDAQASAAGETFLAPLAVNGKGQVGLQVANGSPFYTDPQRGLSFLVDPASGLEVSSASPFALRLKKGGNVRFDARKQALVAEPTTDDVKEADGSSLTSALVRERNARVASDEALDSRVTTLENSADIVGVATLSGGEATVLDDGFVGDETILLSYQEIGSAPGYLYAPSADYSAGVRWKIKSTSATDDGTVFYRVRRAT